jgi:hypothetical protein
MKVSVYIRSNHVVLGRQKLHDAALNSGGGACNQTSTYLINDAVQDRLLEPDSMEIVQAAQRLPRASESVQYVDVGYPGGWLRASLAGVWQIPTVVVNGVKYRGAIKARRALEKLIY